jgi:hypothetical protein
MRSPCILLVSGESTVCLSLLRLLLLVCPHLPTTQVSWYLHLADFPTEAGPGSGPKDPNQSIPILYTYIHRRNNDLRINQFFRPLPQPGSSELARDTSSSVLNGRSELRHSPASTLLSPTDSIILHWWSASRSPIGSTTLPTLRSRLVSTEPYFLGIG